MRWKNLLTALKDSRAKHQTIMEEAAKDPVLERALDQDIIRRWLDSLPG